MWRGLNPSTRDHKSKKFFSQYKPDVYVQQIPANVRAAINTARACGVGEAAEGSRRRRKCNVCQRVPKRGECKWFLRWDSNPRDGVVSTRSGTADDL